MEELILLQQNNLSVLGDMRKFDELMVQRDVNEEPRRTFSRFHNGLRPEITMLTHLITTIEQTFQLALDLGHYLQTSTWGV